MEERARLIERVRVAEAQRSSALEKQHELTEHHRLRAKTAETKLARCRLRLAGRAMMSMARHMGAKTRAPRRSAREALLAQETTPHTMIRNSTTSPLPRTPRTYFATARGSPVHMGVALKLDSPEWHVKVLRHHPTREDS